jgi:hypothetical protein
MTGKPETTGENKQPKKNQKPIITRRDKETIVESPTCQAATDGR